MVGSLSVKSVIMSPELAKYVQCFADSFDLDDPAQALTLQYQSIDNWDSVGHMTLMSALEDTFDIVLEMDDIIDFSSFEKGKEILKKYEIIVS